MKIKQAVQALSGLAQESRLEVFRLLVRTGEEGLAAGEISERLDIPPATMSFHLKELTTTGLIAQRRNGRSLIYSLQPEVMRKLLQFLVQDCCQGRPELCQLTQIDVVPSCREPRHRSPKKLGRKKSK